MANRGNTGQQIHSEEWKQMMRDKFKGRTFSKETRDKISKAVRDKGKSEQAKESTLKHIKALNEKGFVNKGGKCKFFEEGGMQVQGRYEQAFARFYKRRRPSAIIQSVDEQIVTPFGRYRPDFDLGFAYAEVKSHFTINELQMSKINWNNENNEKKVIVVLLEQDDVENYLNGTSNKLFDLSILNTI